LFLAERERRHAAPDEADDAAGAHQSRRDKAGMNHIGHDAGPRKALGEREGRHHQGELGLAVGAHHRPVPAEHETAGIDRGAIGRR